MRRSQVRCGQDFLEFTAGEIFLARSGVLGPEETLRCHDDERLEEVAFHLPAQDVEVLRRCGQIADLDVVFRARLEETLNAAAGMLRALAFVAVRQEQDDAAWP